MAYQRCNTRAEAISKAREFISRLGFGHILEYDDCIRVNDRCRTFMIYYFKR